MVEAGMGLDEEQSRWCEVGEKAMGPRGEAWRESKKKELAKMNKMDKIKITAIF
jgi:hypothetical protein